MVAKRIAVYRRRYHFLTSNLVRAICEPLDLLFAECAKHDHGILTLFEPLLRFLESFRGDETAVNPCPSRSWRDFLASVLARELVTWGLEVSRYIQD